MYAIRSYYEYRPGSEVLLANALAKIILEQGVADEAFLQRFVANLDELRAGLLAVDLEAAVQGTGLSRELLEEAVITSYSIHYTKLYELVQRARRAQSLAYSKQRGSGARRHRRQRWQSWHGGSVP